MSKFKYTPYTMAELFANRRVDEETPETETPTGNSSSRKSKRTPVGQFARQSTAQGDVSGMEHYTMNTAGMPVYHPPKSKLIPGKPPQKTPFTILQDKIKIMQNYHDPITFSAPVGNEKHALWLKAKREGEHRQRDPVWQAETAIWNQSMQKMGLTPEGKQLGGLRQIMIQRMNQLRGGR